MLPVAPRIAFLVTEDWFFASHFLPMARAARELGLEVSVMTRVRQHQAIIEATGARVIAIEADRGSINPLSIMRTAYQLAQALKRERPDLIHCITLRAILAGGLAARWAGIESHVFALTGLGFLGARKDTLARLVRTSLRWTIRAGLESRKTCYLLENPDDGAFLGLDPADKTRVTLVGGAGVDPDHYQPMPWPPAAPLKIAVVARMLWSKGIDQAVEAAQIACASGANVHLSLFGAPDPSNPKAISEAQLEAWGKLPNVAWHGHISDVRQVWAGHHVCCLPSRGGEGLPRTLLEAAACGRAIVTTDVPGCHLFVRDGLEGRLVPVDDPQTLAHCFIDLAATPKKVETMGQAARHRLENGFTERDVMEAVKNIYQNLLKAYQASA